jgi:hypothetical protein
MDSGDVPASFPIKFGENATPGTYIRPIPEASQVGIIDGAASLETGFPPLNWIPLAGGGVPPFGQDVNGILYELSAWAQWQKAGGPIFRDGTFSTSIGGYPQYALLQSGVLGRMWLSKVDANAADPDVTPTNWFNLTQGRLIDVQSFGTPGSIAYTQAFGVNMLRIRGIAGGGAGGGTPVTGSGQVAVGGGAGSGSIGEIILVGNFNGTTITIGAAGTPATGLVGGNGGNTSFGSNLVCLGGQGGSVGLLTAPPRNGAAGGGGGAPTTSGATVLMLSPGNAGLVGVVLGLTVGGYSGKGADSMWGAGGSSVDIGAGVAATGAGSGGSGSIAYENTGALAGGAGRPGRIIIEGYST